VIGLTKIGHSVIRNLLLPLLPSIAKKISLFVGENSRYAESNLNIAVGEMEEEGDEEEEEDLDDKNAAKRLKSSSQHEPPGRLQVKLERYDADAAIVENCKSAVLIALGKFMVTSMRMPSALDLEINSFSVKSADRHSLKAALCSDDSLVADLAEGLVPYYVSTSRQLDYCRMFL
jgi:hypothetical protein